MVTVEQHKIRSHFILMLCSFISFVCLFVFKTVVFDLTLYTSGLYSLRFLVNQLNTLVDGFCLLE